MTSFFIQFLATAAMAIPTLVQGFVLVPGDSRFILHQERVAPHTVLSYSQRTDEYSGLFKLSEQKRQQILTADNNNYRSNDDYDDVSSIDDRKKTTIAAQQVFQSLLDDIDVVQSLVTSALEEEGDNGNCDAVPRIRGLLETMTIHFETTLNDLFGSNPKYQLGDEARKSMILQLRQKLQPLLCLGPLVERVVSKPEGYAGDYLIIDWLYQNKPRSKDPSSLSFLLDQQSLQLKAVKAVQNRRKVLGDAMQHLIKEKKHADGQQLQVMSMASGPAREIYDVLVNNEPDAVQAHFSLIDLDSNALGFVKDWMAEVPGQQPSMTLHQKNLILLASGKETLDLPPQDLIYSMGLIDYFSDRTIIRLLNYAYDNLKPGGKVMLGQFHKCNPTLA